MDTTIEVFGEARMRVRPGTNDHNVCYAVLVEDEYRFRGLQLEGSALDIGAHIGAATVALGLLFDDLHIIAIEPVPDNVLLLLDNINLNGISDRVTVFEGVAGRPRKIAYNFRGSASALHHANIGNQTMPRGTRYDTLRAAGMPQSKLTADFAKIDCEGGEWDILPALRKIGRIHGELHPRDGRDGSDFADALYAHEFTWHGDPSTTVGFEAVRR